MAKVATTGLISVRDSAHQIGLLQVAKTLTFISEVSSSAAICSYVRRAIIEHEPVPIRL